MTRLAIIFIVVCAVLGALFYAWKSSADEHAALIELVKKTLDERRSSTATVVYAVRDVPEGGVITADSIVQRSTERSKIPDGAIRLTSAVIGKKAKYGVIGGQIISEYDLDPLPKPSDTIRTRHTVMPQRLIFDN